MSYAPSVISVLLQPIFRRRFAASVARHGGDRYVKHFSSWDHLVALVAAQLSGAASLRALELVWASQARCHYHLGAGPMARSTLADANVRRPAAILAETFTALAARAHRGLRRESDGLVELIDASPIPLPQAFKARAFNGRIKGAKLHLVHDPRARLPLRAEVTPANVNDVVFSHGLAARPGVTHVFDKGYYALDLFAKIHAAGACFVTRAKTNSAFRVCAVHGPAGATILADERVVHVPRSRHRRALAFPLRRITVRGGDGRILSLLSNDLTRPASEIAALYRERWQIELLFRWIKQNLKIKRFFGRSENAVRLQIFAALIAYVLIRLAAEAQRGQPLPLIRFTERLRDTLFLPLRLETLAQPPPPNRPRLPSPETPKLL